MSIYCKLVRALAVILMATPHIASQAPPELSSTLYSTISGAPVGFSNENVTFTCIIRGSNQMEWTSDQYIGTGGRSLDFISTNMPGRIEIQGEAVAILIRAARNEVIESQLFIRIRSSITNASVQCQDVGTGMTASIEFRLADNDISVDCDKQSVCPGEAVTCVCATGSSNTLAWAIDQNRLEFASSDPLLTRRDVNAFGILTNRSNENRIEVITSNLTVTASTEDTSLRIQCENVDRSTSNPVTIPVLQTCPEVTTPPVTKPAPNNRNCVDCIIAAVFFAVISLLLIILSVSAILYAIKEWNKIKVLERDLQQKKGEITELKAKQEKLENDIATKNTTIHLLDEDRNNMKGEVAEQNTKINNLQLQLRKKEEELGKAKKEIEEKQKELKKLRKEAKEEREKLNEVLKNKQGSTNVGGTSYSHSSAQSDGGGGSNYGLWKP